MGSGLGKVDDQEHRETALACLREMVQAAQDCGLRHHIEISGGDDNSAHRQIAKEIPGLRYTLDYAHSLPRGAELANLMQLHDLTAHIHAKPACEGVTKAFAPRATTPWATIFADLRQRGWEGDVVVECIAYPVDDPAWKRSAFLEVEAKGGPQPPEPSAISHPVFQTVRYAYELILARQAVQGRLIGRCPALDAKRPRSYPGPHATTTATAVSLQLLLQKLDRLNG